MFLNIDIVVCEIIRIPIYIPIRLAVYLLTLYNYLVEVFDMNRTEMRNPASMHLDEMSTMEMVRLINSEYGKITAAVDAASGKIAEACDAVSDTVRNGGHVFYIGAGTSGRLGVLDASEIPPTFGADPSLFVGVIAGGDSALRKSSEGAEDIAEWGAKDLREHGFAAGDILVGISASGGPAYVLGAMEYAKSLGAKTVSITNNFGSRMEAAADIAVVVDTGEEVLTGSTRMKAGTAQKIVLNILSTVAMVENGNVCENLMINLKPTNIKLRARMIRIVKDLSGADDETAEKMLEDSGWDIRKAVGK